MSRGLGRTQRRLIEILDAHNVYVDTYTLTARVYDLHPNADGSTVISDAQARAVHPALMSLEKQGMVYSLPKRKGMTTLWGSERAYLVKFVGRPQAMGHAAKLGLRVSYQQLQKAIEFDERCETRAVELGIDRDQEKANPSRYARVSRWRAEPSKVPPDAAYTEWMQQVQELNAKSEAERREVEERQAAARELAEQEAEARARGDLGQLREDWWATRRKVQDAVREADEAKLKFHVAEREQT